MIGIRKIDECEHEWCEPVRMSDHQGREWEAADCALCGCGSLKRVDDPGASLETFLDLLAFVYEHRE